MWNPTEDPLQYDENYKWRCENVYMIDTDWFKDIHCRQPLYGCINFYEWFILDENDEIIDSIKLHPKKMGDQIVETDKETYHKIQFYKLNYSSKRIKN